LIHANTLKEKRMKLEIANAALQLSRGQTLKLENALGSTICARSGTLWVTEENSREDIVLQNGACHRIDHRGLTLVQAFADASVSLN
jgi:hypothetical protein